MKAGLEEMVTQDLINTVQALAYGDKGLLAIDEREPVVTAARRGEYKTAMERS